MKKYWQPFIVVLFISCVYALGYFHGNSTATKIYISPNDTISKTDTSYIFEY